MGPTASGKTALAEALADATGLQLVNADAFQVYCGMDIGTAKSTRKADYLMMDLLDPWEPFGAGQWIVRVSNELTVLHEQGRGAIVVGGTLYYIRALFEGYSDLKGPPHPAVRAALDARDLADLLEELSRRDPAAASAVDPSNRVRVQRAVERLDAEPIAWSIPTFRKVKIGLDSNPDLLRSRIAERVPKQLAEGWLDEVRALTGHGVQREDPGMRAHGYRALWDVVLEGADLGKATQGIVHEVCQYAKRQRTWLRTEPELATMPSEDGGSALATALALLGGLTDGQID